MAVPTSEGRPSWFGAEPAPLGNLLLDLEDGVRAGSAPLGNLLVDLEDGVRAIVPFYEAGMLATESQATWQRHIPNGG